METSTIPPNIPIVPGTIAGIYKDEPIQNPYLQIIFAKVLDKDNNGQPRWKYPKIDPGILTDRL